MRVALALLTALVLAQAGGGLQIVVGDIGKDGDIDVVSGGKSGLFLAENIGRGR